MLARPELPKKTTLTDKAIEKLPLAGEPGSPPGKSEYIIRDDIQPGFYLLVGRRTKSFMAVADGIREGRRRTMKVSIGRPGDRDPSDPTRKLTADKARKLAAAHIKSVQAGSRDPVQRKPKAMTLQSAWAEYKAHLETLGRSEKTVKFYADHMRLGLAPLANRTLTEIQNKKGIRAWFAKATREHGKGGANGCARTLSAIFNFVIQKIDEGDLTFNPVKALTLHKLGKSKGGMLPEEIPAWGAQYRAMENRVRAEFALFTLLSGSRPEVISRGRIEHVDWLGRKLTLVRPKGKEAAEIPLSLSMMRCLGRAIAAGRFEADGSAWLFPSALSKRGHIREWKEPPRVLSQYGRSLRKSYRTLADRLRIPETYSRALMLHAPSKDGAHNDYLIEDGRVASLTDIQDRISAAIVARVFPDGEPSGNEGTEMRQRRMGPRPGTPRPPRLRDAGGPPRPEARAPYRALAPIRGAEA